ncbi:MAG TPA: Tm-1-like ATP-binding domain-containing protein, partial [Planctomycetia bacterium]|nr:Tm-1-like ATP-binding domain-containing protein [Planctomycetia bacterium]
MSRAYVIATLDTKGEEALFVAGKLRAAGAETVVVDVGVKESPSANAEVSREEVAGFHPDGAAAVLATADRGEAVAKMSEALVRYLVREQAAGKLAGAIGLGGSGGTALVAPALRALPIGVPKAIVSTMASGNTRPYVGSADIAMFYSVVDVAGLNRVSRRVLANAAHALAGMIARLETGKNEAPTVGMTMFGVTTPCVTAARTALEAVGVECLVFHATGTGGQAMENLVDGKALDALLDLTTTEVADEIVGGVL